MKATIYSKTGEYLRTLAFFKNGNFRKGVNFLFSMYDEGLKQTHVFYTEYYIVINGFIKEFLEKQN